MHVNNVVCKFVPILGDVAGRVSILDFQTNLSIFKKSNSQMMKTINIQC